MQSKKKINEMKREKPEVFTYWGKKVKEELKLHLLKEEWKPGRGVNRKGNDVWIVFAR